MYLETENNPSGIDDITEEQLREVFRNGHGDYLILYREKYTDYFIRASIEGDAYDLEYSKGSDYDYYVAEGLFPKEKIEHAFINYLNNNVRWFTDFKWIKLEPDQTDEKLLKYGNLISFAVFPIVLLIIYYIAKLF